MDGEPNNPKPEPVTRDPVQGDMFSQADALFGRWLATRIKSATLTAIGWGSACGAAAGILVAIVYALNESQVLGFYFGDLYLLLFGCCAIGAGLGGLVGFLATDIT